MPGHARIRLLLTLISLTVVASASVAVIMFARGYRPNFPQKEILPTGILVAQSYPDGANIYLDGQLKSATNTTLTLTPGSYTVEIKKDGFTPWKKDLEIQAEVVTRATAWLFPSVPSLKAITSAGSSLPSLSPDGTKIAYLSPAAAGFSLYTLDLTESPLGLINRDPKLIMENLRPKIESLAWSPDSRQILAVATASAYLVDLSPASLRDVSDRINTIAAGWDQLQLQKDTQKSASLPPRLKDLLATVSADLAWSPNEKKILYTATASAAIPEKLINPLPGSSTQPQARLLIPGGIYVYDLEEDRNFQIDTLVLPTPSPTPRSLRSGLVPTAEPRQPNAGWNWFSSSSHLYRVEGAKIVIKEYDNQNPSTVYAGPMTGSFAAPYPSGKQILILTNLNPDLSPHPNLYAVSLR